MRVAMLAPFGIRPKGTLLARMLPLAQALTRRGHTVRIIAPPVHNPDDAGRSDTHDGVAVYHTARPALNGTAGTAQAVWLLVRAVLTDPPGLIHLFKPKGYSGLAALLLQALRPDIPLVVDTDDWEGWGGWNDLLPYPPTAKHLFAWQEHDLPRRAAAVTVASRTLQSQVWGFGVPRERVFYLPNGIHLTADSLPPRDAQPTNPPTIVLYTRFWEFGLHDLIAALVPLVQHCPAVRLVVIGRGEHGEEQTMLALAQRAGVAHAIDYRGWLEPTTIPAVLARAHVALVPLDDTLINRARCSAKLLELMAAGVPVVAANVGQVAEYITAGESGLLVPPASPAALAEATIRLLATPALQQRLRDGAFQRLRACTWAKLAVVAEEAYTSVIR
ncbi:MAG: glycosyltransferase family 4 protein [Chloroflexaceae bacterium]|nr:glycosyltransferase family 4 protein [Chloroflexaceae bacterium]